MKRYIIGAALILLLTSVGSSAELEKLFSKTIALAHVNQLNVDTLTTKPVLIERDQYTSYFRCVRYAECDSSFGGDTIIYQLQVGPYREDETFYSVLFQDTVVVAAERTGVDTMAVKSPRYEVDSLTTLAYASAQWMRARFIHKFALGETAADTALVGETFRVRVAILMNGRR